MVMSDVKGRGKKTFFYREREIQEDQNLEVTKAEKTGLRKAGIATFIYWDLIIASLIPKTAAIKEGPIMGASDRIFITIKGKSSHGSQPENGVDTVAIASNVVSVLQSIVARNMGPLDSAVISICKIHGGMKYNVIADKVELEGTVRSIDPTIRNAMPEKIENLVKGVTSAMGGDYEFTYVKGYPPTINDADMANLVFKSMQDVLGNGALVAEKAALGGEDFAFFAEKIPSAYFWLGCRDKEIPFKDFAPIHNPKFNPDEDTLAIGVELMVQAALSFCMDMEEIPV